MSGMIIGFFKQFFMPLGFVALLLFLTLFLIKKHPKTAIWFVLICLVVVGVFGNPIFSTFFARSMEWRHMPPAAPAITPYPPQAVKTRCCSSRRSRLLCAKRSTP